MQRLLFPRWAVGLLTSTLCGWVTTGLYAADVHVRVSPEVKTGIESKTEYPTIQMAMDHHPFASANADGSAGRVYIHVAPGVYHERVIVTQNHANITLLGEGKGPEDVVITNSLNAKQAGGTFFTETVEINGAGFEADNITFENSAGNTGQAVAAAVRADRAIFKHCRFLGHQDTLFADFGRQYYVDSYIEGGVDFIFGNATAVFNKSELHANGPGYVTAQSRTSAEQTTGYVILNSRVTSGIDHASPETPGPGVAGARSAAAAKGGIGLGRPWRPYARVVYLDTALATDVHAAGWNDWGNAANEKTAYFAECNSTGPGARPAERVPWSHQLNRAEASRYMPSSFLAGPDGWNAEADAGKLP